MSETREQFRERITTVMLEGLYGMPYEPSWHPYDDLDCNGAEAVYAQALRDFKEHLLSKGFAPDSPEFFAAETDVFAAERGIDLDGGE